MKQKKKDIFLLVDGSAIIHRAYHAMPQFTSSDGVPTGAVMGFFSMLLKLMQNVEPHYIAVCFDLGKPTFRQELYVEYHANRPKTDTLLVEQFDVVRKMLSEIAIPVFELDGYEADDLIGTVNRSLNESYPGVLVYIVSGDRDMLQLVDRDTHVLMPVKGISEVMIFDSDRVEEKYGVRPDQIIDLKAFMGDPSDNYPGVRGVGPKTASELLSKYEHFENVYKHLTEIESENPRLAHKLAEGVDEAHMAKKLAKIEQEVPMSFDIKLCDASLFTREKFEQAFSVYEFKTLTKRLDDVFGKNGSSKNQMKLL